MHKAPKGRCTPISAFTLHPLYRFAFGRQVTGSCAFGEMQSCDSLLNLVDCAHRQGLESPCRAAGMENYADLWEPWVGLQVQWYGVTLHPHLAAGCYLPV
jgi:hypothetical protein